MSEKMSEDALERTPRHILTDQSDLFGIQPHAPQEKNDLLRVDLDQWFTPAWSAEILSQDALAGYGTAGVIEPSCGHGAFLSCIPPCNDAIGIDIDPVAAATAREITGRTVVVGDYSTTQVTVRDLGVVIGNPPFRMDIIDAFVRRSYELLPKDGLLALILPTHVLSTTGRVERWRSMFSIEQRAIPRSLFPRLSLPLAWTRFVKDERRTLVGFMLFDEQHDVSSMPKVVRKALGRPGTWREAVGLALHSLGGSGELGEIYRAVEPRRPTGNKWWKDKVRQTAGLYFERVGEHRFAIPEMN